MSEDSVATAGAPCSRRSPFRVSSYIRPVHWLQQEMLEGRVFVACWVSTWLRKDEFQLVAATERQVRTCLGAHADPVNPRRGRLVLVCLDRDRKADVVERRDKGVIELQ